MGKNNIRDKLYAVGLYLLLGVVLFLLFMGIKYVLIALCAYLSILLLLDIFYLCAGVRTIGTITGYQQSDSKFYENDEYGFRRHPDVVAPPEYRSDQVLTGISYQARGRSDTEDKTCFLPTTFWYDSKMIGREITIFYLPQAPQKARHISVGWFLLHAALPLTVAGLWLSDLG
ncbi:MAG: hypothetical protein CVV41_10690 [Candidatus Riflebacteria bacterium HGW-Riflebacteria-1]|jgi:hypothetical protein|nr:MAG: hypothetical protein CVV41_10690 [Candidatus Riflebacteria bacterium HGW-Riflebacteria-1]